MIRSLVNIFPVKLEFITISCALKIGRIPKVEMNKPVCSVERKKAEIIIFMYVWCSLVGSNHVMTIPYEFVDVLFGNVRNERLVCCIKKRKNPRERENRHPKYTQSNDVSNTFFIQFGFCAALAQLEMDKWTRSIRAIQTCTFVSPELKGIE